MTLTAQDPAQTAGSRLSETEELNWLAILMTPGLETRRFGQLLERVGPPSRIVRADPGELEAAGLSGALARSIASGCGYEDAAAQQRQAREAGAQIVTLEDSRYPELLRAIFDPPPVLFARGRVELMDSVAIAVVGTRRPTPYGIAAAEKLSGDLALAGVTIASGMARGIDTAAHRAVLAIEGQTIAVLGCGADIVYPAENRKLAAQIAAKGLILSEFPMATAAFPQNFPVRNRIVSGLSRGVLVVEGAQYSGSGITARLALDQGREVFSVPGNITSKMSWGPNLLIKQGAKLVQDWNDVVVELPQEAQRRLIEEGRQRILAQGLASGTPGLIETSAAPAASDQSEPGIPAGPNGNIARRVLGKLQIDTPVHLDRLVDTVEETSPSEIIAALFELEVLGLAKQLPGRNFVKVW